MSGIFMSRSQQKLTVIESSPPSPSSQYNHRSQFSHRPEPTIYLYHLLPPILERCNHRSQFSHRPEPTIYLYHLLPPILARVVHRLRAPSTITDRSSHIDQSQHSTSTTHLISESSPPSPRSQYNHRSQFSHRPEPTIHLYHLLPPILERCNHRSQFSHRPEPTIHLYHLLPPILERCNHRSQFSHRPEPTIHLYHLLPPILARYNHRSQFSHRPEPTFHLYHLLPPISERVVHRLRAPSAITDRSSHIDQSQQSTSTTCYPQYQRESQFSHRPEPTFHLYHLLPPISARVVHRLRAPITITDRSSHIDQSQHSTSTTCYPQYQRESQFSHRPEPTFHLYHLLPPISARVVHRLRAPSTITDRSSHIDQSQHSTSTTCYPIESSPPSPSSQYNHRSQFSHRPEPTFHLYHLLPPISARVVHRLRAPITITDRSSHIDQSQHSTSTTCYPQYQRE
ncbi:hypothetical protein J6590_021607 [Homalodisca vitripennis]|nr:hypothetical protein J6590_021607 [Homalodisca vitripennis]